MKLKKVYLLLLASVMFTACSDDSDSWNTGNATVSMEQQEITVKENKGIFNVPIVVKGEQNGPLKVTVEVTETGANPGMSDVHYFVTSKTIVIPADATTGNIEVATVDDNDINEIRTFTMKIVKAEGATIADATTIISLRDNDSAFYEKLQGKWKMTTTEGSWDVSIVGYEEGDANYDKVLYITGMMGYGASSAKLLYHFDVATKKGSLEIPFGTLFAEGVNFTGLGSMDVYLGTVEDGYIVLDGSIEGAWNDDFTQITFKSDYELWGFLAPVGTTDLTGQAWFGEMLDIKLTKK